MNSFCFHLVCSKKRARRESKFSKVSVSHKREKSSSWGDLIPVKPKLSVLTYIMYAITSVIFHCVTPNFDSDDSSCDVDSGSSNQTLLHIHKFWNQK
mmetsp:Transcript_7143/g.10901  ORF Transcript_7143/g.10901 Transcript_7143/m.10901 type:complete len:97 (-) Transcript_7143:816-1106(-)